MRFGIVRTRSRPASSSCGPVIGPILPAPRPGPISRTGTSVGAMGVSAVIVPRPMAVSALEVTGEEVRVTNTGPDEDEYSFTIDRQAALYGWVTPPTVKVPPGGEGSVKVLFRLPKAPKP